MILPHTAAQAVSIAARNVSREEADSQCGQCSTCACQPITTFGLCIFLKPQFAREHPDAMATSPLDALITVALRFRETYAGTTAQTTHRDHRDFDEPAGSPQPTLSSPLTSSIGLTSEWSQAFYRQALLGRPKKRDRFFCHRCGVTSTPHWRSGPDGRNTLCNVRSRPRGGFPTHIPDQPCGLKYAKVRKMYEEQCSGRVDIYHDEEACLKQGFMA